MPRSTFALLCLLSGLAACEAEQPVDAPPVMLDEQVDMVLPDQGEPDAVMDAMAADAAVDAAPEGEPAYTARLNLPAMPYNYANPDIPEHFRVETMFFHDQRPVMDEDTTPPDNPITDAGATLGRVLFYDTNLSQNRTVSCASCHRAELGFSDDRVLSEGFEGGETARHSMGLTNARFYREKKFFWDQRADTLEEQVLMPFQDEVEMGMTLDGLVARIEAGDYYPALFESAFGDAEVTPDRISKALAQFVRSLFSAGSKYDVGRAMVSDRGAFFPNFTDDENRGKALFVQPPPRGGFACFICHQGEAFIASEATNNGLDADFSLDGGYGRVTNRYRDGGKFKVPSLRNVALRAPYMHDGRFATLEEVIDHYSEGIQPNPNLGAPFGVINGQATRINMSPDQKRQLVAFLNTLTDLDMVNDPKFADPFLEE
jgi:cytochrome c peroxidase